MRQEIFRITLFLALVPGLEAAEPPAGRLVTVKEQKDLKIDSKRIRYRGTVPRAEGAVLKEGEIRIRTENPRVIAAQGYDRTGACRLRLITPQGAAFTEIHCESDLIRIPADRDIVWIGGRTQREGYQSLGKPSPYAGLNLYDFTGKKIQEMDKDSTGIIGLVQVLPDGALIVLHSGKEFKGISRIALGGGFAWRLPISDPVTDMRVFGDGDFIATQAFFFSQGKRKAVLYGPGQKIVKEFDGTSEESPEILGVSADNRHFVFATSRGRSRQLKVFATTAPSKPVKEVAIGHAIRQLEIDNDLRILGAQFSEIKDSGAQAEGFRIIDFQGNILAEQECSDALRGKIRLGKDQRSVSWSCGAEGTELETSGAQR